MSDSYLICRKLPSLNFVHTGKCSDPMLLSQNNVRVMGYEDPALVGESITFTCPSGQILNGPRSSTCMENREWEPDPGELNCTERFQPTNPVICGHPQYVLYIENSITIMTYKEFRNSDFTISLTCCSGILVIEANKINCFEEVLNTTQFRCERKCKLISCILLWERIIQWAPGWHVHLGCTPVHSLSWLFVCYKWVYTHALAACTFTTATMAQLRYIYLQCHMHNIIILATCCYMYKCILIDKALVNLEKKLYFHNTKRLHCLCSRDVMEYVYVL